MSRIAICPGSFDPPTFGHLDIIRRAARLYDRLVVAVGNNVAKTYTFTAEERIEILQECCREYGNVDVQSFRGLLVDLAKGCGATAIVKGLRAVSDFEYEFQMAVANRQLDPGIETVFLMTSQEYAYLSSSIAREIAAMGGDVSALVPPNVEARLKARLRES